MFLDKLLGRTPKNWTNDELACLTTHYQNPHCSQEQLLQAIPHRTWQEITRQAKALGLHRGNAPTQSHVATRYFQYINSHEKAYMLGVVAAIGTIQHANNMTILTLEIDAHDALLLERFVAAVMPGGAIDTVDKRVRVQLQAQHIITDITQHGIDEQTQKQLPRAIPMRLTMDFLLGYFDGAGSLYHYQEGRNHRWRWSMTGTQHFLHNARHYIATYANVEVEGPVRQRMDTETSCYILHADSQYIIRRVDAALNSSHLGLEHKHFGRNSKL